MAQDKAVKEYFIGTGGWAYYHIPGLNPLAAYSRAFNFVEVNTTFYQIPPLSKAQRWRKIVPQDFHFAVRANRAITHTCKFQPTEQAVDAFEKTKQICTALDAEVMHLQAPQTLRMTQAMAANVSQFLNSIKPGKTRLALEIGGASTSKLPTELVKIMQDHNVIHCVDLSRDEKPAYESDVLYSRLFGKGTHNIYQPTDDELVQVDRVASSSRAEKVMMSFHFVRMYKDAARLKVYKRTGQFPQVTGSTGLSSLEEVLSEDASFPATKQELINTQGWKLFDLNRDRRIRAEMALEKLPERAYSNVGEVAHELRALER